jgi:hypothetical protein
MLMLQHKTGLQDKQLIVDLIPGRQKKQDNLAVPA